MDLPRPGQCPSPTAGRSQISPGPGITRVDRAGVGGRRDVARQGFAEGQLTHWHLLADPRWSLPPRDLTERQQAAWGLRDLAFEK